jgi:hypothetical protein
MQYVVSHPLDSSGILPRCHRCFAPADYGVERVRALWKREDNPAVYARYVFQPICFNCDQQLARTKAQKERQDFVDGYSEWEISGRPDRNQLVEAELDADMPSRSGANG